MEWIRLVRVEPGFGFRSARMTEPFAEPQWLGERRPMFNCRLAAIGLVRAISATAT